MPRLPAEDEVVVKALALAFALLAATAHAQQPALSDEQKIAALIHSVADLRGAVFVRNGSEYDERPRPITCG